MISELWRLQLYYLGLLAAFAFALRFIVQWLCSEKQQRCVVPKIFWQLSLAGNILLWCHSLIQMQFHVALIQNVNGVISWRNLNLLQPPQRQWQLRNVILLFGTTVITTVALFYSQDPWDYQILEKWFRTPTNHWSPEAANYNTVLWHSIGSIGLLLFNSRFWLQWYQAEATHHAGLNEPFWWMSLMGAALLLAYFVRIADPVNIIGPLFGLVPYVRNLMLLKKNKNIVELKAP